MTTGYLIRNGQLHDGSGAPPQVADIRTAGAQIVEIGANLPARGETIVDATGLIVTPGLIDLHVHAFTGMGQFGLAPDEIGLRTGTTTVLDTGTAGALTYPAFHRLVIEHAREDVFALLHISIIGCLQGHPDVPPAMGELSDARYFHVPSTVACVKKYRDRLIGTKVRLTAGLADGRIENERAAFQGALEAAKQTGTFLMVHHVASNVPTDEMLNAMRAGDIVTHLYHPQRDSAFAGPDRKPTAAALRARERGVVLDVGHGIGSFAWSSAEPACQQHGFWPDTISTDIHQFNVHGPVHDMPTTMSKFLHLGMSLAQVIGASTHAPAQAMRLGDRFGLLKAGRQADITLLRLEQGSFDLYDVLGKTRTARQRLVPVQVIKRGELHACRGAELAGPSPSTWQIPSSLLPLAK